MMSRGSVLLLYGLANLLVACGSATNGVDDMALPGSNPAGDMRASKDSGTSVGPGSVAEAGRSADAGTQGAADGGQSGDHTSTPPPGSMSGSGGNPNGTAGGTAPGAGMAGTGAPDAGTDAMPNTGNQAMQPVAADGWPLGMPEDYGTSKSQLDTLAGKLQTASGNTRSGLVVVKEGTLIYEKYWNGAADTMRQVFSCTKSWGSTLVGIAVHKGLVTTEDPVTKWIPAPASEVGKGAIIKHLLTQTAQTTPPGTAFAYNSSTIVNTLPEILEAASGMSSHAFYKSFLAEPLKLTMQWPSCAAGGCSGTRYKEDYIQFGDRGPNPVLQSTVRDQAKLGWLWLDDGVWNGERLLDTTYIQAATKPSFAFQSRYGYLWWLNRMGPGSGPVGLPLAYDPDVPDDTYHAVGGIGNCSIGVFPTQRMVIVHIGDTDSGGIPGHWNVFAPLF